jgi:diguanylate cyclase (GGDEF)-like protein
VAVALLQMPPDSAAAQAAHIDGWDVARNYQPVHELYQELRQGPYERIDYLTLEDFLERYSLHLIIALLVLILLLGAVAYLGHLRRGLLRLSTELERRASHDELTGLPNRRLFNLFAERVMAAARRDGKGFAVCFIDLDGFKKINDAFGHEAGDEVLRFVSQRLLFCAREQDLFARQGGDEFIGIITSVPEPRVAESVAQRILDELAKPLVVDGLDVRLSASIGLSYYPDDHERLDGLLSLADQAMYRAKESGKNRFEWCSEPPLAG